MIRARCIANFSRTTSDVRRHLRRSEEGTAPTRARSVCAKRNSTHAHQLRLRDRYFGPQSHAADLPPRRPSRATQGHQLGSPVQHAPADAGDDVSRRLRQSEPPADGPARRDHASPRRHHPRQRQARRGSAQRARGAGRNAAALPARLSARQPLLRNGPARAKSPGTCSAGSNPDGPGCRRSATSCTIT